MAFRGMPEGGGPKSKDPMPACTKEYWPSQGGEMADAYESEGAPGDKGTGGLSAVTGNTEEGEYNHDTVKAHGNWPHSPADPDVEGPPLGSDAGPNGLTDSGPGTGPMPNDRRSGGY